MIKLVRTFAGVVSGYAAMVLLITLVQEVWFGGVGWNKTPAGQLAIAGLLTCVAAAIGAMLATVVARPTGRLAAVLMACLVVVETTALIAMGKLLGPLWFDVLASASLIVALIAGAEIVVRLSHSQRESTVT